MGNKGIGIHLLKRLAIFVVPETLLFLNYAFSKHVVNINGIEHVTDAALGVAIFTVFLLAGWAIYLIIDMLLLFKKSERAKAMVNVYFLIGLTIGAIGLLVNLYA
jgi:mannitol-specific phosphotransferase system IIBC component